MRHRVNPADVKIDIKNGILSIKKGKIHQEWAIDAIQDMVAVYGEGATESLIEQIAEDCLWEHMLLEAGIYVIK